MFEKGDGAGEVHHDELVYQVWVGLSEGPGHLASPVVTHKHALLVT